MKRKGLYVLATAVMLALAAGCGSNPEEANPQNQVTEATTPTDTPEATATPEPTATPAPTATPVPANYMEANGSEVLGAGWHVSKDFIWYKDETGKERLELADYESMIEVSETDNGDGTKTIYAELHRRPHIEKESGVWWSNGMGGFVDLQSGKAFFPLSDNMEQTTVLKQGDKNYELKITASYEGVSPTYPYYTERYTLVCPSDYEDAGFYLTGYNHDPETFTERAGFWKKLNYIRHGESDMLVFGVNQVLATMGEAVVEEKPIQEPEGNYFEENGFSTKGEGTYTWLGTEFFERKNNETGEWEMVSVETKEVETEIFIEEESLGDGTKLIKGTFVFVDEISEDEARGIRCTCGVADKKSGLVYAPRTYFLAEPHVMEKDGEEISVLVAAEQKVETVGEGKEKVSITFLFLCPENYDDAVFFITGKYESTERDYSEKREPYFLSELENGETDLLFFR